MCSVSEPSCGFFASIRAVRPCPAGRGAVSIGVEKATGRHSREKTRTSFRRVRSWTPSRILMWDIAYDATVRLYQFRLTAVGKVQVDRARCAEARTEWR